MNEEPALPTGAEIERRLRVVSELRNLCLSLGQVRLELPSPLAYAPRQLPLNSIGAPDAASSRLE